MATRDDAYLMRDLTRDLLQAGRLWRKIGRRAAARHGVSEAGSAPLIWIDRLGRDVRQTALADAIGIEGASLVRLLDELQASGLITRDPDPSDRRANAINLTPRGQELVVEINEELAELRLTVFKGLSRAQMESALKVFDAIKVAAGDSESP